MRSWRPDITSHAIARWLERVIGAPVIGSPSPGMAGNVGSMLNYMGLTKQEAVSLIWPDHIRLEADPGCTFAMVRDDMRYVVREGRLITVLRAGWRMPNKSDKGEE